MADEDLLLNWKKSIEDFVIADLRRSIGADNLQVGLIILSFVAVETLSGYFCGEKADKDTFKKFIQDEDYFSIKYRSDDIDTNFADNLYHHLRSKLVHDYVSKRPNSGAKFDMFREVDEPHLERAKSSDLIGFSAKRFAIDVLHAWEVFKSQVHKDEVLRNNVLNRIKGLGFLTVQASVVDKADLQNDSTRKTVLEALRVERDLALAEYQLQQTTIGERLAKINSRIATLELASSDINHPIELRTNVPLQATGINMASLLNPYPATKFQTSDDSPIIGNKIEGSFD